MSRISDEYFDSGTPPMLDQDGVTILVSLRGRTADGVFYDGFHRIRPGDDRYDELLPAARNNPRPRETHSAGAGFAETRARLLGGLTSGERPSRVVLDRLRAVSRTADRDRARAHARSRRLLMREYLRRAAVWARAYGADDAWPFFDIAGYVDPTVTTDPEVAAELEEFLRADAWRPELCTTLRGAVRWAALRTGTRVALPDLPDPYEPLLLMYERGGGFSRGESIDLGGQTIPCGDLEYNLAATPLLTLDPVALTALETDGRVTYYAKTGEGYPRSHPRGIVRRRLVGRDAAVVDEAFTRNLRWEPTEYLRLHEISRTDVDHVEITEAEAAAFVREVAQALDARRGQ